MKPTITVFTPTYNRAHLLGRCYESLVHQTNKDFMWLIIDDGSKDGTSEMVAEWQNSDNGFRIEYVYKENRGMHTAHNVAYERIDTELNVCVDSDDRMPMDAIDKILKCWTENKDDSVAGIVALDSDFQGNIISRLPEHVHKASTLSIGPNGDKKYVYRTDIMKGMPLYPEYEGEKLVPLSYLYDTIARSYAMLLLREIVCEVDYQKDGSSNTIIRQYKQSPRGFAALRMLTMRDSNEPLLRWKSAIHFVSCCIFLKDKTLFRSTPRKALTFCAVPFGILLNIYIRVWLWSHQE